MKYRILVDVTRASGVRTYECEAPSKAEALRRYRAGKLECTDEQLEAEALGEPEIEEA